VEHVGPLALIGELVTFSPGKLLNVVVHRTDGLDVNATAYQEFVLVRTDPVFEKTAFLLHDLSKSKLTVGATIEVVGTAA
jgi:hypothetical protein